MNIAVLTRCKDEFFVAEFCEYYLSQGIHHIYIIDDDSLDKSIYDTISNNPQIIIVYKKNILETRYASTFYKEIKNNYDWIINVDVDEFITTKRNIGKTIRDELLTTFKDADCVRIPWVMMACNGLENNPKSVLKENVYRMNHDIRHLKTNIPKFSCKYDKILVKSVFKPKYFDDIHDHLPMNCNKPNPIIVDSIDLTQSDMSFHYQDLRERKIDSGFLLCYHYRIISKENCKHKLKTNKWYIDNKYKLSNLMESDYPEIIDETMRHKSLPSVPINKTIYILWLQGFKNAPRIVRMCMNSWIRYNPDWTVIKLDRSNLSDYVDLESYRQEVLANITNAAFSDIIRIELLSKFGGLWVDATLLCMRPLNNWLPHYVKGGFFVFEKPADDRLVSSWFIYSNVDNNITQWWLKKTRNYCKLKSVDTEGFWKSYEPDSENYFWFHCLFGNLYKNNIEFREKWNQVPKLSAVNCHYLQKYGLLSELDTNAKDFIDNSQGTVQKLTYKIGPGEIKPSSLLQYIFYKNALKFIHIPKTGGTSIENASMDKGIYWGKNDTSLKTNTCVSPWHCIQKDKRFFFCVIRCPYDRIISEFYHQNEVENYNRANLNKWIKMSLQNFFENENHSYNHFIQQVRFAKHCNIQISFENLNKNLSIVLDRFELPNLGLHNNNPGGKLQKEKRKNVWFDRLSVNDIDRDNIDLINKTYSEDIELWHEIKEVGIKWGCNL